MATIQSALARFGFVTVMDAYFFPANKSFDAITDLTELEADGDLLFKLDTLRISNFTQEGPTKTAKGGINAETIFRYGKTARLEMEDVVGRIAALEKLMGIRAVTAGSTADVPVLDTFTATEGQSEFVLSQLPEAAPTPVVKLNGVEEAHSITGQLLTLTAAASAGEVITVEYEYLAPTVDSYQVTEEFEGSYSIFGRTFVINQETGDREYINIIIHKFLPDSLFNQTMEAEGDFGTIAMSGELFTNDCGVFYEFTTGYQPAAC